MSGGLEDNEPGTVKLGGWRFNKDISLADLVSIGIAAVGVILAYSTLDKRVSLVEQVQLQQRNTDQRQDDDHKAAQARIDAKLQAIDAKLDQLILRGTSIR